MKTKRLSDVALLHCIGVLMILFGHFAQVMNKSAVGELLITGVPLFLFLSGYLTGLKRTLLSVDWLKRKCLRILTPYYLILAVVFIVFLIIGKEEFRPLQWIVLSLNLHGLTNFLFLNDVSGYYSPLAQGLGHFWYVTIIMLCYLIIIAFSRLYDSSTRMKRHWIALGLLTVLVIQPILLFYNVHINCIVVFLFGWLNARNEFKVTTKRYLILSLLMLASIVVRFILKHYIDDTIMYNKYCSVISSNFIGIWIFYTLRYLYIKQEHLINRIASWRPVLFLESIIYEFFLIHHIFTKGEWSFFKIFDNTFIAATLVIVTTALLSIICKGCSKLVNNKLENIIIK
ncbi:acyltransferase family protein [Bacteroides sp.]